MSATAPKLDFDKWWSEYLTDSTTSTTPAFVFIANYINEPERRKYIKDTLKVESRNYFTTSKKLPSSDELWKLLPNILFHMEYTNTTFIGPTELYELSDKERTYDAAKEAHQTIIDIDPILDYFWEGGGDIRPDQRNEWYKKIKEFYQANNCIPDFKTRLDYAKEVLKPSAAAGVASSAASEAVKATASDTRSSGPKYTVQRTRHDMGANLASKGTGSHAKYHRDVHQDVHQHSSNFTKRHLNGASIGDELLSFNSVFPKLYKKTIADSQIPEFDYPLVYFYILQSISDTILLSMLIFNMGSKYSEHVLYNSPDIYEFDLLYIIDNDEDYQKNDKEKYKSVDLKILETLKLQAPPGETTTTVIIKLYIIRYYRIVILEKICKNIQEFTKAIKDNKQSVHMNEKTIESIETIVSTINSKSHTGGDAKSLYRDILETNIDEKNSIIKYSRIMYYKALINFAVSISLKEEIPTQTIIDQITRDTSLDEKITNLLLKDNTRFDTLYRTEVLKIMREPIIYSIFTGLHSSKLFKETEPSTSDGITRYIPKMDTIDSTYYASYSIFFIGHGEEYNISTLIKRLKSPESISTLSRPSLRSGPAKERHDYYGDEGSSKTLQGNPGYSHLARRDLAGRGLARRDVDDHERGDAFYGDERSSKTLQGDIARRGLARRDLAGRGLVGHDVDELERGDAFSSSSRLSFAPSANKQLQGSRVRLNLGNRDDAHGSSSPSHPTSPFSDDQRQGVMFRNKISDDTAGVFAEQLTDVRSNPFVITDRSSTLSPKASPKTYRYGGGGAKTRRRNK
jgi:hypothetical protein